MVNIHVSGVSDVSFGGSFTRRQRLVQNNGDSDEDSDSDNDSDSDEEEVDSTEKPIIEKTHDYSVESCPDCGDISHDVLERPAQCENCGSFFPELRMKQ